jgi:hypothetical protein
MKLMRPMVILFVLTIGLIVYFTGKTSQNNAFQGTNTTGIEVTRLTRPVVLATNTTNTTSLTRPECRVKTGYPDGTVNLRRGAGLNFGVRAILNENDVLESLGIRENGFLKIVRQSDNATGFVKELYIICPDE